jgi:glycerophosphoryl diester phosphodiesterase
MVRRIRLLFRLLSVWLLFLAAATAGAATPEIIAHRGASHDAPENTIAAIMLAWEQQADAVEFDVYLSKDGQIVLMHDATTKRTAGVDRKVVDQTLAELRKLDVGGWKDRRFAGERIATLAEALDRIPSGKRALIEVKCGPEIVPELKRVIDAAALKPEQTAVISFDAEVIAGTKAALPKLQAYWLCDPKPDKDPVWTADALRAKAKRIHSDGLNLSVQPIVTAEFIADMKAEKLPVYVWTVDSAEVAKTMIAAGVVGITTNRPAWLREQLTK